MKRMFIGACLLLCLLAPAGFAQVINATLSGTVADTTGALVPGVEVSATNTATGVVTTALTNESGAYRFGSLQPGAYRVAASLPGFQPQAFQLTLGTGQQIRQNFNLQVGNVSQSVEVSVAADQLLTAVSSSVGNVLPEKQVEDLPLVGRNVMNLANIMPGVVGAGGATTTFAGVQAGGSGNINLQLDGMTVNNGRFAGGLAAATAINPDMVDEVRVIVAAVDVEGRGSGQVQVRTRSGTNQFHGGAVWNVRNSVLNANSWSNNRQGLPITWFNRHQYTASLGGPIIKNRTFFFGLFDGQNGAQKQSVDAVVLTPLARQGIFRFFPGINNGNAETTRGGAGTTLIAPVVDRAGNPLAPSAILGATGPMQSFSVFGDSLNPGDPNRRLMDPSGYIQKVLAKMPDPNWYGSSASCAGVQTCDGLNTAVHRWTRRTIAGGGGIGTDADQFRRHEYAIKIDHNFNSKHKLTGSWIEEHRYSDNNALSPWPTGWNGEVTTDPSVKSLQLTSTLSPTLLNEFRFGRRITTIHSAPGYSRYQEAFDFMTVVNGIPVMQHPVLFSDNLLACGGFCNDFGDKSPLSSYTETLNWTKGAHAFKFGTEFRYAATVGWSPNFVIPHANGGAGDTPVRGIDTVPGLLSGSNLTLAQNLLLTLAGSVDNVQERFELREPTDPKLSDYRDTYFNSANPPGSYGRIRDTRQNEFNFFVKDDWRVTPNLTLNLGVRYDLMRVPYFLSATGKGYTAGLEGGNMAAFGYSGRSFAEAWMSGGGPQKGDLTKTILIGPKTDHESQGVWASDKNNFAPAVGFAWSPSFGGKDKTTVRGGYQIAYQLPGNSLSWIDLDIGNMPGFASDVTDRGSGVYRDFTNMVIPVPLSAKPFETIPITQRAQNLTVFDANYTTPYVQTFTLGVTRSLTSNLTMDLKYVGTRGIKLTGSIALNDADIRNNGLLQALTVTRAGGDAPMFDVMLKGLNFGTATAPLIVGQNVTGSEALRRNATFRANIANGDFVAVARTLSTTNLGTTQPPLTNAGLLRSSGAFPANFIVANPQFNEITWRTNADNSNYHSFNAQLNLRQYHGFNYQATYVWSKSLGLTSTLATTAQGSGFRDLQNQRADYTLQSSDRRHDFRSFGTFDLPFGPGKLIAGNTSGVLARAIEGWKVGAIINITSGAPLNVTARNTLYSNGTPNLVGAFPRKGDVVWPLNQGDIFGNYFGQQYKNVSDCGGIAANLTGFCTNTALADANGNIVLRNAAPGELGSLGLRAMEGPGSWSFDANLQKSVRVAEAKNLTFRMDATNVLNHPTPGNPNLSINTGTFGQITTKTGSRSLQAQLRFDF